MDLRIILPFFVSNYVLCFCTFLTSFLAVSVAWTVLRQILFKRLNEPPVVFHWVPIIGSTIGYGRDPIGFFSACKKKYGDVFTFILLRRKVTVYLGTKGNSFIPNGKHKDVNAEEIYSVLTTPVFGSDVVYDCPNSKLMEQKKFIKFGLASDTLQTYAPLMEQEIRAHLKRSLTGVSGILEIPKLMAEITIFTASRSFQGKEIREKLDTTFAKLYHDLDDGFQPINFMLPWVPLSQNRRRDVAQRKMTQIYTDIIQDRRKDPAGKESQDMLWNLMRSEYKDGTPVPEHEIAHMIIALLMAGQHSSSVTSCWILLRLASQPQIIEDLYQEELRNLGGISKPLTYEDLQKLPLIKHVIKETLRIHPPIHSIMRKVTNPLPVEGINFTIPPSHVVLAAPSFMSLQPEYFPDPSKWDPHRWENMTDPVEDEKHKEDYGYGLVSTGATSTYSPFGAGRHRCIGEHFAYLQISMIIAIMVRELKLRNLEGKEGVVATNYSSLFSRPMAPALVRWERRNAKT